MKHKEIALSLAGGGARGAYQAGALLALAKKNIVFNEIAGTSIGTLNGAFYAQSDGSVLAMEKLCNLWREIGTINIIELNRPLALSEILKVIGLPLPASISSLIGSNIPLLNTKKIAQVMDKHINYQSICNSDKNLIITVVPSISSIIDILVGKFRKPEYFFANSIDARTLRQALLAATAIPLAFPSVRVNGKKYSDAGLSTPLPSKILHELGYKRIVSVFLSDDTIQNRFDYPECNLIQIRPSQNINTGLGSMLDFSLNHIEKLIKLGEEDVNKYISEIIDMFQSLVLLRHLGDKLQEKVDNLPKIK
jgi:NTE family protein